MSTDTTKTKRILILSSAEIDENIAINDAFVHDLNAASAGIDFSWHNYHNIGLELDETGLHSFVVSSHQLLDDFDAVYFKSYFRYHEQATAIAESLQANGTTFVGSELKHYIPAYKLSQMARLSKAGITIPKTVYLPLEQYIGNYSYVTSQLGDSFVFKAINGSTGDDNYLVHSAEQLQGIVAANPDLHFIAQAFVPNDSDLRFLIIGGEIKLIIKRSRLSNDTHLNNTSQGAKAELLNVASFDESVKAVALQAAKLMDRDVAGVDIMLESETGKAYVLEVNASPQIASGSFEAEKRELYSNFFEELLA